MFDPRRWNAQVKWFIAALIAAGIIYGIYRALQSDEDRPPVRVSSGSVDFTFDTSQHQAGNGWAPKFGANHRWMHDPTGTNAKKVKGLQITDATDLVGCDPTKKYLVDGDGITIERVSGGNIELVVGATGNLEIVAAENPSLASAPKLSFTPGMTRIVFGEVKGANVTVITCTAKENASFLVHQKK